MMYDFSQIIYPGSPFLPTITQFNRDNLLDMTTVGRHSSSFSLAYELCEIGIDQNKLHFEEYQWLYETFKVSANDISDFLIGFTNPATLLMGVEILRRTDIKTTIRSICPVTDDPEIMSVNQYKTQLLIPLYQRIADIPENQISKKLTIVFDMCNDIPFLPRKYYQAGVASCYRTGLALITSLPT